MPPPPASSATSRLFLGPALRLQPDRRLVSLVRDGYEIAFEEIVRRYGKPLGRYAAAIVSANRAEDVTQDAFSKALLALRDTGKEIELRPWLYRIVRNTALNELRDQPQAAAPLHEDIDGVETPPEVFERREELAGLLRQLRSLPEPQRAAIVMRELEGLSHEEIAAALGLTGGAARQTIYRARRALRDGFGMLIPIPALHYLLAPSAGEAAAAGLGGAAAAGGAGFAASAGGAGAGTALKAGLATVLVAGSVGTGVAIHDSSRDRNAASAAETPSAASGNGTSGSQSDPSSDPGNGNADSGDQQGGPGRHRSGGKGESGDDRSGQSKHASEGEGRDGGGPHGGRGGHGGQGKSGGSGGDTEGGHHAGNASGHSGGGSEPSDENSGSGKSGSGSPGSGGDDPPEAGDDRSPSGGDGIPGGGDGSPVPPVD